jgi:hypothetical protein
MKIDTPGGDPGQKAPRGGPGNACGEAARTTADNTASAALCLILHRVDKGEQVPGDAGGVLSV